VIVTARGQQDDMPNILGRAVDAAVCPLRGVSVTCSAAAVERNPPGDVWVVERRQHLHLILEELRRTIGVPMLRLRHPVQPQGQTRSPRTLCTLDFLQHTAIICTWNYGRHCAESAEAHRFTASLVPPEVMTLYTSADDPLPMTSSLMMSLPRQVSA
jgi:hypothetical protein